MQALELLYEPSLLAEFSNTALRAVAELFPDTVCAVDFVNTATGDVKSTIAADNSQLQLLEKGVEQFIRQNPVVRHLESGGAGNVFDLDDFIGKAELQKTDLYEHVMAPLGIGRQISFRFHVPGYVAGATINRGWGSRFGELERFYAEMLRRHFARAYANSQTYTKLTNDAQYAQRGLNLRRLSQRGLTRREIEVLSWLVEGKRDAEIATILNIGVRSINTHVSHILSKLGCETRAAAAYTAQMD